MGVGANGSGNEWEWVSRYRPEPAPPGRPAAAQLLSGPASAPPGLRTAPVAASAVRDAPPRPTAAAGPPGDRGGQAVSPEGSEGRPHPLFIHRPSPRRSAQRSTRSVSRFHAHAHGNQSIESCPRATQNNLSALHRTICKPMHFETTFGDFVLLFDYTHLELEGVLRHLPF